jgi:cell division topological specificity factor
MFKRLMQLLNRKQKSKSVAKSRLQLILVQDRTGIDEEIMESLQTELTEVLSKYFILERDQVEMEIEREQDSMALVANIPVLGTKVRHPVQA